MRDQEYSAMFELEEHLGWFEGMRAVAGSLLGPALKEKHLRSLDVGCGTGFGMTWLRDRFKIGEVFGIDPSPRAAEFWPARGLSSAALASVDKLPFGDCEFDLVTCFDVVYQLNDARASAAVGEIHRVLKPGALLFIREPAYQWMRGAHDVAVGTHRRYTLTDLRRLLRAHGFTLRRSTYANTLLFWAAAPHRLFSKWRGSSQSDVKPAPRWLNSLLSATLRLEGRLLDRMDFPFGLSAIILAEKKSS